MPKDPRISPVGAQTDIRMMMFAASGRGKTSLIATAAAAGRKVLLIRSPLDHVPRRALGTGMEEWVVSSWEDLMGGSGVLDYVRYEGDSWDWIWLDCWSIIQHVMLDDVWAGTVAEKPSRAFILDDKGQPGKPNLSPSSGLDKGEYGRNMERTGQFLRHMVGSKGYHLGITAHAVELPHPDNPDLGLVLQPWIQGKGMIPAICGMMNVICYLDVADDDGTRVLKFKETETLYAKDQTDSFLPDGEVEDPDLGKITDTIEKSMSGQGRQQRGSSRSGTPRRGGRRGATTTSAPKRGRGAARREH